MKIVFYILIGLFGLLGFGTLNAASQSKFKNLGLVLGGLIIWLIKGVRDNQN